MGKSYHVHTEQLRSSGGKLGDFGGKLHEGGAKLQSTGEQLTSHVSGDRSGIGSAIAKAFGKGLGITGKVFGEAGRVTKGHGERLRNAGKLYEENDQRGHSRFNKLHPEANVKGPKGSAATESAKGRGGSGGGHVGPGGSARGVSSGSRGGSRGLGGSRGKVGARNQVGGNERAAAIDPKNKRCTKDPVDLATGEVLLTQTDVELPGTLPLVLSRTHLSSYRAGQAFGASWVSTVDQRIEVDAEGVVFVGDNGVLLVYPLPTLGGGPVLPAEGARHPLRLEAGGFVRTDPETGHRQHFPPVTVPAADAGPAVAPLTAITDRAGHRIDFDRDPDGTVTAVRHSGGYHVEVTTVDGQVTGYALRVNENPSGPDTTDPAVDGDSAGADAESAQGAVGTVTLVTFGYDDGGRLVRVVNPSGQALTFDYDGDGRLTEWVDRNGMWYRYSYVDGRCVLAEGAGGQLTTHIDYDLDARITTETDSLGHATRHHFNEALQVVKTVDPLGGETQTEYDAYDRLLARTDQLGRTTRFEYAETGDLLRVTRPDGSQLVTEYNADHLPVTIVDPDGAVWHRTYDDTGNLVTATDPAGAVTRYDYDADHHIAAVTNPLGAVTRIQCDPAGLPVAVTEPGGGTTHYARDAFGRVTQVTDPVGGTTRLQWTLSGNLAARTDPAGGTEYWRYDGEDNLVEYVDALGRTARTEYAGFDLPTATVDATGARTEYAYDTELRLVAVTNPAGLTWRYSYDAVGNPVSETDVNGITTAYEWDAAGGIVSTTNALGETTTMVRDPLGRVVERRTPDGVTTIAYDAADRVVRATNPDADLVLTRDALGRIVAETCNGRTLTSTFDPAGQRIRRQTPTGASTDFVYDPLGRLASLRTGGNVLDFDYDAAGREIRRRFGMTTLVQTWDAGHRLRTQAVTAPGPRPPAPGTAAQQRLLQRRSYNYRDDGAVTDVVDQLAGVRHFDVDPLGRITAVRGEGHAERYDYDPIGNLAEAAWPDVADSGAAGPRTHTGTLVRTAGRVRYEHDGLGRVVARHSRTLSGRDRSWRYGWTATGQLAAVTTPDGVTWCYVYDALDRRIAKLRLGQTGEVVERVDFVWDGPVLAEQIRSDGHTTSWEYQPDSVAPLTQTERVLARPAPAAGPDGAVRDAPQEWIDQRFYGIVTDLVGTPTELLDAGGNLAWRHTSTVWGTPLLPASQPAYCPLRFPGQYYDPETGDHYNFHRYYDPTGAVYTTPDPLGLDGGANPHAYVPNPQTWADPLGLTPCNQHFNNRKEAFNAIRQRAGIPRTQQPTHQWTVGDDPTRRNFRNYHYDSNPGAHGRYYQYETPQGTRVIAEHTADPNAPHPHFHLGGPPADPSNPSGRNVDMRGVRYKQIGGKHHYYYHNRR